MPSDLTSKPLEGDGPRAVRNLLASLFWWSALPQVGPALSKPSWQGGSSAGDVGLCPRHWAEEGVSLAALCCSLGTMFR